MAYFIIYSDGCTTSRKFVDKRRAIKFIKDKISNCKDLKYIEMYFHNSGFHSTTQYEYLVYWHGKGHYWDNRSKIEPRVLAKQFPQNSI